MIKQGVVNYFKSLNYFFTSLGVIALFFVLGMSIALPMMSNTVTSLTNGASEILQESSIDWDAVRNSLVTSASELDFNNPSEAISTATSNGWINNTLSDALKAAFGNFGPHEQEIKDLVSKAIGELSDAVVLIIIALALGVIFGLFVTQWQIRREMTGSSFGKRLLGTIVDSIIYTALIMLCVYLSTLWKIGFVFSILIALIIVNIVSLLESYIVSGRKKARFGQVVNIGNILKMLLVDVLVFAITTGIVVLAYVLTNWVVTLFVAIPLVIIAFLVIQLNADNYVKNMKVPAPNNSEATQVEQTTPQTDTEQKPQTKKSKTKKQK